MFALLPALALIASPAAYADFIPARSYFEDRSASMPASEVVARADSLPWSPMLAGQEHFGYTSSRIWIRFRLPDSKPDRNLQHFLEVPYHYLDRIDLYETVGGKIIHSSAAGLRVPLYDRDSAILPTGAITFRIVRPVAAEEEYFLSVEGDYPLSVPMRIMDSQTYTWHHANVRLVIGTFLGGLAVAFVFILILAVSLWSRILFNYAAFLAAAVAVFLAHEGVTTQLFWGDSPWWAAREIYFYLGALLLFYVRFLRELLDTRRTAPLLDKTLLALLGIALSRSAVMLVVPVRSIAILGDGASLALSAAVLLIAIVAVRKQLPSARYVLASAILVNSVIGVFMIQESNLIWVGDFVHLAPHVGVVAEVVLLGVALADRFRQANLEYLRQRAALVHSEKLSSLGRMAGEISHEINNPLAIIHGNAAVLSALAEKSGNQEILQVAQTIEKTANRISRVVQGMRRLARNAAGAPVGISSFDVILQDALVLFLERSARNGVRLDLPAPVEKLELRCRSTEVCQVLVNLLENSFDAVADQPDKWVRVEVVVKSGSAEIAVVDSGPGVPHGIRQKIHEPFFTTKVAGHGLGLGLSISRNLLESQGGKLWLDESSSHTRFAFSLPLA
jgi:signal transduction histidine kinase